MRAVVDTAAAEAAGELPFFVYGTLRPGEPNYDLCLRGRTAHEEPARLEGALLYDGPGYPYVIEDRGTVVGDLITAKPGQYGELLAVLDELEEYFAPGDPANVYERVARDVLSAGGTTVSAWVYFAAPRVAHELRARGRLIAGGDWLTHVSPYLRAPYSPAAPASASSVPRVPHTP
ncbi:gamma-glutamylcyclotransferase family protein [Streptomyces sp. NPDC059479]|uniref:gamma-glutamylcyclotransferase family protein n=1 Tax=Streptomyces sp. NPDC059479 TaxID=3346848 RepID=UPI0036CB5E7B